MTLQNLRTNLQASLIERDDEIDCILLGMIAREHVLFVGPPGVAKSHLCRSFADGIADLRYCERLLAPTTPPEAVFGPISLAALRDDRFEHVSEGSCTDAELVFFDEFFRGSDAIRDTLLHLLGPERQALVGTQQVQAPLITCIGASNSWADSADQQAVLDRWLIRKTVRPVSPAGRQRLMFDDLPAMVAGCCSLADLSKAQRIAAALPVSQAARETLTEIADELAGAGIRPSDRRWRASLKVARAAAAMHGHSEVLPIDLEPLQHVLWDVPQEQPQKAAEIVCRLANPVGAKVNAILSDVSQIVAGTAGADAGDKLKALKKLESCEKDLKALTAAGGNGRAAKALEYASRERVLLQASVLGISAEKAAGFLK
jgi:MoxR-like ATPase